MKFDKKLLLAFLVCLFSILACQSGNGDSTPTPELKTPTLDPQKAMEMTRGYQVVQTMIAGEQATDTPEPESTAALPAQWTEISTRVPTNTVTPTLGPSLTRTPQPFGTLKPAVTSTPTKKQPGPTKPPATATRLPPTATNPPPTAVPTTAVPPPTATRPLPTVAPTAN
jgi:hypothetical protein